VLVALLAAWLLGGSVASAAIGEAAGHPQPLPANVRPPLSSAARDEEVLARDGCTLSELQITPRKCIFGKTTGHTTIALVGDSHAAQWFPALDQVALQRGWRLVTFTKVACRFLDIREISRTLNREYTECERWRTLTVQRLAQLNPGLVVVASAGGMEPVFAADGNATRQGLAMARLLRPIRSRIAILVDTPWLTFDPIACIAAHRADLRPCDLRRSVALRLQHGVERIAVNSLGAGASLVDMTNGVCPGDPCPVVLNGMIVYRDSFHLTATFAKSLASALAARLPAPGHR
jgi:hypothetical protein